MELQLQPGKYLIAVSGGVDSVVLLDLLVAQFGRKQGYEFVVAHYNHGIRNDSTEDEALVRTLAEGLGLPFFVEQGALGRGASEAEARAKRYAFLEKIQAQVGAQAIITAHHQDDLLETIILNLLRGTGRKGLSSLQSGIQLVRPLLDCTKAQLVEHALTHNLRWREDSTNQDEAYLRNYIRKRIVPRLDHVARETFIDLGRAAQVRNQQIDMIIHELLDQFVTDGRLFARQAFIMMPHGVAKEVLAEWLRQNGLRQFDARLLERIVVQAKTLSPGKRIDVYGGAQLAVEKTELNLALSPAER